MTRSNSRKSGIKLKCAKCGVTSDQEPSLRFHRFPLPRSRGSLRARAWAEYAFPNMDWTCEQKLVKLYNLNTMLCSKHFHESAYTNSSKTRLNAFALPCGSADTSKIHKNASRSPVAIPRSTACHPHAGPATAAVDRRLSAFIQKTGVPSWTNYTYDEKERKNCSATHQRGVTNKHTHSNKKQDEVEVPSKKRERKEERRDIAEDSEQTEFNYMKPERENDNYHFNPDDTTVIDLDHIGQCVYLQYDDTEDDAMETKEEHVGPAMLSRVCRVCVRYCSDAEDMTPLLRGGIPTAAAKSLTSFSPQIKISANDHLPMQMCSTCAHEAIRAERFYRRVEETHSRLSTLTPHDIVQYSLSLGHYFPERNISNKLGEDDETAVISLRYDGDQHLELCFNNEPSTSYEVEAITEKSDNTLDTENGRKRRTTEDNTQKNITDPQTILLKFPNELTLSNNETHEVQYEALIMNAEENYFTQKLLEMEDIVEEMKEEPVFDASETIPLAQTAAPGFERCDPIEAEFITDVDTTFRCSECYTDFVTQLEAEQHMESAHGPVPAYVCYECSQTIATKRKLRLHLRRHIGVKPYEYQHCYDRYYCQEDRH